MGKAEKQPELLENCHRVCRKGENIKLHTEILLTE